MDSTIFFGNTCQNGLIPALVRPPLPGMQTVKHFLPLPLDTGSALSLFPGFNAMDPVQKAVLHHTLGLPASGPKRKHVSCSICQLRFNSQSQAVAHYKGTKHAKKLKALDSPKTKLKGSTLTKELTNQEPASKTICTSPLHNGTDKRDSPPALGPSLPAPIAVTPGPTCTPPDPPSDPPSEPEPDPEDKETEEEKARRLLYCSLCKVAVNSKSQLDAHNSGTKHKTMLEARTGLGSIKSFPRAGIKSKVTPTPGSSTGLQNKTFFCEICDVHVNSETQLKQHISSRRHKDRAAGKPAKPKYSPYSKPLKPAKHTIKLSLGKELQPISSQILPAHLAAVAAAAVAMGNSFTHSPAPNHTPSPALFQTQPIPASLLRPAPGPVRTSHPQVLFAPY